MFLLCYKCVANDDDDSSLSSVGFEMFHFRKKIIKTLNRYTTFESHSNFFYFEPKPLGGSTTEKSFDDSSAAGKLFKTFYLKLF